jgi:hypothetical protein
MKMKSIMYAPNHAMTISIAAVFHCRAMVIDGFSTIFSRFVTSPITSEAISLHWDSNGVLMQPNHIVGDIVQELIQSAT